MKAILIIGISAILFFQATGLDVIAAPKDCPGTGAFDGADDCCGPFCADCYCCPASRSWIQPVCASSSPLASAMASLAEQTHPPVSATPADIFHIPKRLLA